MNMKIRVPPSQKTPAAAPDATVRSRRKLWEVQERYMCSVVGTCLGVAEIRKIALRDKLCSPTISDYDLHGLIVGVCRSRSRTSRTLHKVLERRYQPAVRRFSKARSEDDLARLWTTGIEAGDVGGPFWALMTHPASGRTVMELAFGDVHMLSHALGASRRVDQQEHERLKDALAKERSRSERLRDVLRQRDDAIARTVATAARLEARLQEQTRLLADERPRQVLVTRIHGLERLLDAASEGAREERARREDAERVQRRLEAEVDRLGRELADTEADRDAATREIDAIEGHLSALLDRAGTDAPPAGTFTGLHVLYVGGRTHLVPHYRALVEAQGGTFTHHDGGLEQHCGCLESLVSAADRVLCPVDAVSHNAALRVKKACKHHGRRFVPLRTSSLASLVSSLRDPQDACGPEDPAR